MFHRLVAIGLAPAVIGSLSADALGAATPQPLVEFVDVSPEGFITDSLCSPYYGSGKEIGVSVVVEDEDGRPLTSLDGYTFELRDAAGVALPIAVGTGTQYDQPVNISSRTASSESISDTVFPSTIFFLNCFPAPDPSSPFPAGTTLVALKDGVDVSSASLAGRFPPTVLSDSERDVLLELMGIFSGGITPCTATEIKQAYRNMIEIAGLTYSDAIASTLVSAGVDDTLCAGYDLQFPFLYTMLFQAFFHDGPLGILEPSTTVEVKSLASGTVNWAAAGHVEAARLEAIGLDDELPLTGTTALWILPTLALAMTSTGTALRRRARH